MEKRLQAKQKKFISPSWRDIEQLAARIAEIFAPQKIILFGSWSYGEPRWDSDVDLLVIMDTKRRPVEQAIEIYRKVDVPFPLDLLVRTPKQVEERLQLGDMFIAEILSKGKVLYEANNQRMG